MKLMKNDENEAAYQMLRMTGFVVRATEEKVGQIPAQPHTSLCMQVIVNGK